MTSLKDNILICDLIDCYKDLLTKHQISILTCYYFDNMSYSEISENFNCSRQSVQDIIKRTLTKLMEYENKLNLNKLKNQVKSIIKENDIKVVKNKLEKILEEF